MGGAYDAVVVGLGAHGSAAVAELARRGARVLGIERFERGHAKGSFVGKSRIIRLAYFEHPDYVPLLRRAWDRWLALERESGTRLLHRTGGLYAGAAGSEIVTGSLRSAREHGLAHEALTTDDLRRRFPWLRVDDGMVGLFEEQAGYLVPERCIEAHLAVAERHGAELRFGDGADDWYKDGSGYGVHTSGGMRESTGGVVLTAGAWLAPLLPDVALPLAIERVPLFWYEPARPETLSDIPVYIVETADGSFYGFPYLDDQGLKVARHGSGDLMHVRRESREVGGGRRFGAFAMPDLDSLDRVVHPGEDDRVRHFVKRYLPEGQGPLRDAVVCMYTKTPDEHFVIDTLPRLPGVAYASACSGHGFKFASVVGEILADLALDGRTAQPIVFLSASRFAARVP
ncbi:MAG: N-methyl-L-tryptophan oxidase [Candidatus Limnocylindria bacterium]